MLFGCIHLISLPTTTAFYFVTEYAGFVVLVIVHYNAWQPTRPLT